MTKRKRVSVQSTRKKRKGRSAADDPEQEYLASAILGERIRQGVLQYLIEWEDDKATGEKFEPTWEPSEHANQLLLDAWEAARQPVKAQRPSQRKRPNGVGELRNNPSPTKPTPPKRPRGRPRRVVDDSSVAEQTPNTNGYSELRLDLTHDPEIAESQQTHLPSPTDLSTQAASPEDTSSPVPIDISSDSSTFLSPIVQLSAPPSSWREYDRFDSSQIFGGTASELASQQVNQFGTSESSEADESQASSSDRPDSPEPSQWIPEQAEASKISEETTEDSLAPTTLSELQVPNSSTAIERDWPKLVPDSQTLPGSSSFVPSATEPDQSLDTSSRETQPSLVDSAPSAEEVGSADRVASTAEEISEERQSSVSPERNQLQSVPEREQVSPYSAQPILSDRYEEETLAANQPSGGEGTNHSQSPDAQQSPLPEDDGLAPPASVVSPSASRVSSTAPPSQVSNFRATEAEHSQLVNGNSRHSESQESPSSAPQSRTTVGSESRDTERAVDNAVESIEDVKQASKRLESSLENSGSLSPDATLFQAQHQSNGFRTPLIQPVDLLSTAQNAPESFTPTPQPRRDPYYRAERYQLTTARFSQSSSFPFATQVAEPTETETASANAARQESVTRLCHSWRSQNWASQTYNATTRASSLPVAHSSPLGSSTAIAHAPSQSISISNFGESAPARPATLSSPIRMGSPGGSMEFSHLLPPRGSLAAKIKANRDKRGATPSKSSAGPASQATQTPTSVPQRLQQETPFVPANSLSPDLPTANGARSPSIVPAMEPLPVITREEMQSVRRYETLLPQANAPGNDESLSNGSLAAPTLSQSQTAEGENAATEGVHAVPVILVGHQRDQYTQMVYHYRSLIQRVLQATYLQDADFLEAKHFIDRIRRITTHPDLDNSEALTQYDTEASVQANWFVSCSAKFRFLQELFVRLQDKKVRIAVVAQPGHISDFLKIFLEGIKVDYSQLHDESQPGTSTNTDKLHVLLTTPDEPVREVEAVDLVIALENTVVISPEQMKFLRRKPIGWSPFVTLIVPRSVEHVERCLSTTLSERAMTRAVMSGIYQFRKEAGRIEEGSDLEPRPQGPADSAAALAEYLIASNINQPWPLAGLSMLENLDSQTESESDQEKELHASQQDVGAAKRGLDGDSDTEDAGNKRLRTEAPDATPTPTAPPSTNPTNIEVTHISDSIDNPTQPLSGDVAAGDSVDLTATETRLQDLLKKVQERLEEHVQSLSDLQYRHEDQRSRLIEVTTERDAAIATAQTAVMRYSEQSNQMSVLRNQNKDLKQQLDDANAKLLDHSVPERAEFETLRLSTAAVAADKERLEKRLEQANKDNAYVRDLYQSSSNGAQTLATQVTDLEEQLVTLQVKASGEQAKLRQLSADTFHKSLQAEITRLRALLKDREAVLKIRDDEITRLKEAGRGRMGTRASSVPRSPRLGSPRLASRQASPAAGELKGRMLHPLRNA